MHQYVFFVCFFLCFLSNYSEYYADADDLMSSVLNCMTLRQTDVRDCHGRHARDHASKLPQPVSLVRHGVGAGEGRAVVAAAVVGGRLKLVHACHQLFDLFISVNM